MLTSVDHKNPVLKKVIENECLTHNTTISPISGLSRLVICATKSFFAEN